MASNKKSLERIFFNITNSCNLSCHYCYANSKRSSDKSLLPIDIIERIAFEGANCGATSMLLSGGEPFFRKDWFDIFKIFDDSGYELSVSSNGTLINERIIKKIDELGKVIFQISLDGSEDIFNKITGVKNAFKRVTRAIDLLIANGYNVQINTVLHQTNYFEMPFLIRYSFEKRVPLRLTLLSTDYGRATKSSLSLNLNQIKNTINAIHIARKINPYIELNLPPLLLHPDDMFPVSPSCGWCHGQCGILANGDITICGLSSDHSELIAGNIRFQSLCEVWENSHLFKRLRSLDANKITGVCKICPFLNACGGSCRLTPYISTGDYYAPNSICQMFYEEVKNGNIDDFPSYIISLGIMDN